VRLFVPLATAAAALLAAGCVDTKACHNPTAWKPCSGATAEPGASGSPPAIVGLQMPTCADLDAPTASMSLSVTDPDGDAQVMIATLYTGGVRNTSAEVALDDAERSGNDWNGTIDLVISGAMGAMLMEGSSDVRIKVTDRQGGQSAPFCDSIAIVR